MELAGVGPGAEKEVEGQDEDRPRARKERHRRSLKCAGRKDSQCMLSVLSPPPPSLSQAPYFLMFLPVQICRLTQRHLKLKNMGQ